MPCMFLCQYNQYKNQEKGNNLKKLQNPIIGKQNPIEESLNNKGPYIIMCILFEIIYFAFIKKTYGK